MFLLATDASDGIKDMHIVRRVPKQDGAIAGDGAAGQVPFVVLLARARESLAIVVLEKDCFFDALHFLALDFVSLKHDLYNSRMVVALMIADQHEEVFAVGVHRRRTEPAIALCCVWFIAVVFKRSPLEVVAVLACFSLCKVEWLSISILSQRVLVKDFKGDI